MCNEYSPTVAPFYSESTCDEHDKTDNVALGSGGGEVEQSTSRREQEIEGRRQVCRQKELELPANKLPYF